MRPELIAMCKDAISNQLEPSDFSYPRAFAGFPEVLEAFANLFNNYFNPKVPVATSHLATAPGAASCLDTLFYNICDPGESILVVGPYWSQPLPSNTCALDMLIFSLTDGFDFQFQARSSVVPIPVTTERLDEALSNALIPALEAALRAAQRPVKAVLITNPSNPLSQCYTKSCIEDCIKFCDRNGLHYISDEVYALTRFRCPEVPEPEPFTSVLAIDVKELGCNLSMVHMVWSTSKDFGQSGVRMASVVYHVLRTV